MGLPQIDFRVPEATWFKSVLNGRIGSLAARFGSLPSSPGVVAWPYKIVVVAVMALVACGTLVTFGSAGAETPSTTQAAPLPGSDEASPTVEGQVMPPVGLGLLNSADLLSTLNLTDYTPYDLDDLSSSNDDDSDEDEDEDEDTTSDIKKQLAVASASSSTKPASGATTPSPSPTTSSPKPEQTTSAPKPTPTPTSTSAPDEPEPTDDRCDSPIYKLGHLAQCK